MSCAYHAVSPSPGLKKRNCRGRQIDVIVVTPLVHILHLFLAWVSQTYTHINTQTCYHIPLQKIPSLKVAYKALFFFPVYSILHEYDCSSFFSLSAARRLGQKFQVFVKKVTKFLNPSWLFNFAEIANFSKIWQH